MYDIPYLDLPPMSGASGTVRLPGSKSISNRVLLLAGLAAGTTAVHDLLDSDDTAVMLEALRTLGCGLRREGRVLHVTGIGGRLTVHEAKLFLGNAGTAMRPLAAALAVLATTQGGNFELSGVPRMHERPIGDLVDALRPLGCSIDDLGTPGYPPLRLHGAAGGQLATTQPIRVRGDVSSQFLTALLLALPLVAQDHDIVIEVQGELISKPYIDITLNLLARFGIDVRREGWQRFTIPCSAGRSAYRTPGSITSKATLLRPAISWPWAPSPPTAVRRCGLKAWAVTRSRATSVLSTRHWPWARRSRAARAGWKCIAAAGRWPASRWTARTSPTQR